MDNTPSCPVCNNENWEALGSRIYNKGITTHLSEYAKIRYEVLFQLWFPNTEHVKLTSILCNKCGVITYKPRPTSVDLGKKYQFLHQHLSSKPESTIELSSDKVRSDELYSLTKPYLHNFEKVLDYGGGNGRLLPPFIKQGHECYVIDYIKETIPNVKNIGATIDDIPKKSFFDLILCSHILEHLAEPQKIIGSLSSYLSQNGIIYVEVPLEIWNQHPLPVEPVTHVNFFTVESLRYLLETTGLEVLWCNEEAYINENGIKLPAIKAIAKLSNSKSRHNIAINNNGIETKKLLSPSLGMKFHRMLRYPEIRKSTIKIWARDHLPKTFFWRFFS